MIYQFKEFDYYSHRLNIVEQARQTGLLAFLEKRHGFTFTHRGGVSRCRQHPSLAVKDGRLSWYWHHSKGTGGHGTLDYLMKIEHLPLRQVVETVSHIPAAVPISAERPTDKRLILSERAGMLHYTFVGILDMPNNAAVPASITIDTRQGVSVGYITRKAG